jgi:hypothetical protein
MSFAHKEGPWSLNNYKRAANAPVDHWKILLIKVFTQLKSMIKTRWT